jgi:Calcineurin-like phosphoesterase
MLKPAFDKSSVRNHVEAVRGLLQSDELSDLVASAAQQIPGDGDAAAKVAAALPDTDHAAASSGGARPRVPYLSRDPLVSLIQSSIEETLLEKGAAEQESRSGLWPWIVRITERYLNLYLGHFQPNDPEWYMQIAKSSLEHLARGNHSFNTRPAEHRISDTARLIVVGDWGTGLRRARHVAAYMQQEIAGALAEGREAHVVHLGDVYYSGLPSEDQRRFLAFWPVTAEQSHSGVTSWSLNGNHDMYSGGFGYFEKLLADPRFAAQHSPDGEPTSFFRLTSPSWEFVGLDTSWDRNVLSTGAIAVLEDPQAEYVAKVANESTRKLALFSHHQLTSVYDQHDIGPELGRKLAPLLGSSRVNAWWWGHEHRAMAFKPFGGVQYPRCLGNGGVPVLRDPVMTEEVRKVADWDSRRYIWSGPQRWARFGFAVIDLMGEKLDVRYRDDDGKQTHDEMIS